MCNKVWINLISNFKLLHVNGFLQEHIKVNKILWLFTYDVCDLFYELLLRTTLSHLKKSSSQFSRLIWVYRVKYWISLSAAPFSRWVGCPGERAFVSQSQQHGVWELGAAHRRTGFFRSRFCSLTKYPLSVPLSVKWGGWTPYLRFLWLRISVTGSWCHGRQWERRNQEGRVRNRQGDRKRLKKVGCHESQV